MAAFRCLFRAAPGALYNSNLVDVAGLIWRGRRFRVPLQGDATHRPFWDKAFAWVPTSRRSRKASRWAPSSMAQGDRGLLRRRQSRLAHSIQSLHRRPARRGLYACSAAPGSS